jgi:Protein of unknown function (DUF3179)
VNGRELHFYLAGINNQNFLMRDRETGTWWQQITGKAIYGPLQGSALDLVLSDELTFGEWRTEFPRGEVLAPVPQYLKEYDSKWEPEVAKLPVVISFPGTELKPRDVVIGVDVNGVARAYPWETFVKQSPVMDRVNGTLLLLVLGPDGKSFRVFVSRVNGQDAEFFLQTNGANRMAASPVDENGKGNFDDKPNRDFSAKAWMLVDSLTASQWNFQGCAVSGPVHGKCLERLPALKDYWFDWRNYHSETTIYRRQ